MSFIAISHPMGGNNPRRQCALLHLGAIAALIFAGCSSASIINSGQGGGAGQGTAGGGGKGGNGTSSGAGGFVLTLPDASADHPGGGNCGDGVIERNEDCDDGNTLSGDGCSQICQVESNYVCKEQGKPCENLAKCGNGFLTSDETCDDGNTESGDGCSSDCSKIEPGYQCRVPGKPCTPKCGDGIKSGVETCDDGNTAAGDGCSATCHIETGFKCDDSTPSKCSKTTCGDGKKEGVEGCDDGNTVPFDGCSEDCQIEPNCTGTVVAASPQVRRRHRHGTEDCDDGNAASGDGCSKDCKKEDGWTCSQPDIGDKMMVPVVYRDFKFSADVPNPGNDFENGSAAPMPPCPALSMQL
jgi:cysteine-rich repeat protein